MATEVKPSGAVADNWCYTDVTAISKFSLLWTINDVRVPSLKSPKFSSSGHGFADSAGSQWCQVCLEQDRDYRSTNIKLGVILDLTLPDTMSSAAAYFKFSLLNSDGKEVQPQKGSFTIKRNLSLSSAPDTWSHSSKEPTGWVKYSESTIHEASTLVNGMHRLKIYCEVVVNTSDAKHVSGSWNFTMSPCDLASCLEAVQSEGLWTDFTLAVGKKEIKVHRIILAARSPVFQRMLKCPMAECDSSRVEITDFTEDVVEEMVHFMYTGEAPNLQSMPQALLTIADKYELKRLKEMCEKTLSTDCTVKNVAATLALADQCNADRLKRSCISFISAHVSEVVQTPDWEALKSSTLFGELLKSFAPLTLSSEVWEDISSGMVMQRAAQ